MFENIKNKIIYILHIEENSTKLQFKYETYQLSTIYVKMRNIYKKYTL